MRHEHPGLAIRGSDPMKGFHALAHIVGLFTLAVAHPLYQILAQDAHAPFLVAHQVRSVDLFALIVLFSIAVPACLYLIAFAIGRISPGAGRMLYTGLLFLLFFLIALPMIDRWASSPTPLIAVAGVSGSLLIAGLATALYRIKSWARLAVSIVSLGAVISPLLFVTADSVRPLLQPPSSQDLVLSSRHSAPDIVMIVFDELPLISLLDENLDIDSALYPGFSRLVNTATWYRNTTSVHYSTLSAMAGLLTGEHYQTYLESVHQEKVAGSGPIDSDRLPHNLFTLLRPDYRIFASELVTQLAPQNSEADTYLPPVDKRVAQLSADAFVVWLHHVCPREWRHRLPSMEGQWLGFLDIAGNGPLDDAWTYEDSFKRVSIVRQFTESLRTRQEPTLYFLHTLLPHYPFEYNENGQKHRNVLPFLSMHFREATGRNMWPDAEAANRAHQAHLLQLQFTDLLLGRILDRLQANHMFEDSLIVVASDHGTNFYWDDQARTPQELALIQASGTLFVPFIIKWPGQNKSELNDAPLQTTDIVPTLAAYLGRTLEWSHSGRSALGPIPPDRQRFSKLPGDFYVQHDLTANSVALQQKLELFGSHSTEMIYNFGPHAGLLGRRLSEFPIVSQPIEFELDPRNAHGSDTPSRTAAYVTGSITMAGQPEGSRPPAVAIAIDGVIRATARTSLLDLPRMMPAERASTAGPPAETQPDLSALKHHVMARLPPQALATGVKNLELYLIQVDDHGAILSLVTAVGIDST